MKIKFRSGYKYQLAEDYCARTFITLPVPVGNHFITLDETGWLTIKADYAWDGPSGPTIDTKNFLRGSLEHDALYQLMREGKLSPEMRQTADLRLHTVCLEDGMCAARAWWVYRGVRYGGESSIQPRVNETLEAP